MHVRHRGRSGDDPVVTKGWRDAQAAEEALRALQRLARGRERGFVTSVHVRDVETLAAHANAIAAAAPCGMIPSSSCALASASSFRRR